MIQKRSIVCSGEELSIPAADLRQLTLDGFSTSLSKELAGGSTVKDRWFNPVLRELRCCWSVETKVWEAPVACGVNEETLRDERVIIRGVASQWGKTNEYYQIIHTLQGDSCEHKRLRLSLLAVHKACLSQTGLRWRKKENSALKEERVAPLLKILFGQVRSKNQL